MVEKLEDRFSTFQYLLKSTIDTLANKKRTVRNLVNEKIAMESDLASLKLVYRSLQEKLLVIHEVTVKQDETVKSLVKERNGLIKKYTQRVDELYHINCRPL